ncbi:MAG TPA: hypothetical protein VFV50_04180, partial [Bdellovibrionales bacterium]|nr:hypothetical protein [Bdellovibrionales bacterium]
LTRVNSDKAVLCFTATYNNLALPGFNNLLRFIHQLREDFGHNRVIFYTHLVKTHDHQALEILPASFAEYVSDSVAVMEQLKFHSWETDLVRRLLAHFKTPFEPARQQKARMKFFNFFREYDRRRGTDFLATFPEYRAFYANCGLESKVPEVTPAPAGP